VGLLGEIGCISAGILPATLAIGESERDI